MATCTPHTHAHIHLSLFLCTPCWSFSSVLSRSTLFVSLFVFPSLCLSLCLTHAHTRFVLFILSYFIFAFYSAVTGELILTTILGIAAVTIIAFLFIPHWTAALFVFPLITILYVDLLGVLNFAGLHLNAVSYIAMVMSIGLLVDFLMHILLRFYESPGKTRHAKVKDTLKTMGSSILIGGISTFLGAMPLALSTSEIFSTIFVTFIGLVTLGAGHGLILLPVLLSMLGPEVCIRHERFSSTSIDKEADGADIESDNHVNGDGVDVTGKEDLGN